MRFARPLLVVVAALAGLLAGLTGGGCDGNGSTAPPETPAGTLRVVSLSPAISRVLVDLGLEDRLVGRSRFCAFLPDEVPAVGDLQSIDYERLVALRPTHVLVQAPAAGVDPVLARLAGEHGWRLGVWSGLDTVDDVEGLVRELPGVLHAQDRAAEAALARRAADLLAGLAAALVPPETRWTAPTLLVYDTDPVRVFGRATYLNDLLVRLGGRNATDAEGWLTLTLEDVARADPAAIIVVRSGAPSTLDPRTAAGPVGDLDVAAVRDGRLAILRHPDALMPSTGLVGVAVEMGEILRGFAAPREPAP